MPIRPYSPNPHQPINQPSLNSMMYPKGSKQPVSVWGSVMNVYKAPPSDVTPTPTPSITPTITLTPSITPTISSTPTNTPTPTISLTPSITPTITVSPSVSLSPTLTPTPTISETPTSTPTPTVTETPTNTPTVTDTPTSTPTPTVTETPTNTPTPTISLSPSLTPTNTPTPSFAFDSDASNYINALTTSGATLTFTEKTYINNFYVNAKSQGVYSYLGDFYPLLGGSAATNAINGKSPGTRDLTFFGGWTHNSSGATPNGTNAYAQTIQDTNIYPNGLGMTGYYVGSSYSGGTGQYIFSNKMNVGGVDPTITYRQQRAGVTGNILGYGFRNGIDRPNGTGNLTNMLGFQNSMRTSGNTISYYAQANLILSGTSAASIASGNTKYVFLAFDGESNYGVGRCQFANVSSWSTGSTSPNQTQLSAINTLINQLQTDFGRSVI